MDALRPVDNPSMILDSAPPVIAGDAQCFLRTKSIRRCQERLKEL